MKERPILFSGEMVRAILDGRKTQTRRILNPQPLGDVVERAVCGLYTNGAGNPLVCKHGQVGDRLWVRETWTTLEAFQGVFYRADQLERIGYDDDPDGIDAHDMKWRPSIHMPRWASRITLEIIGVCVERLQDISEQDAIAEGPPGLKFPAPPGSFWVTDDGRRKAFRSLWESINGPGSWEQNPWVWVIEFKRLETGQ